MPKINLTANKLPKLLQAACEQSATPQTTKRGIVILAVTVCGAVHGVVLESRTTLPVGLVALMLPDVRRLLGDRARDDLPQRSTPEHD